MKYWTTTWEAFVQRDLSRLRPVDILNTNRRWKEPTDLMIWLRTQSVHLKITEVEGGCQLPDLSEIANTRLSKAKFSKNWPNLWQNQELATTSSDHRRQNQLPRETQSLFNQSKTDFWNKQGGLCKMGNKRQHLLPNQTDFKLCKRSFKKLGSLKIMIMKVHEVWIIHFQIASKIRRKMVNSHQMVTSCQMKLKVIREPQISSKVR